MSNAPCGGQGKDKPLKNALAVTVTSRKLMKEKAVKKPCSMAQSTGIVIQNTISGEVKEVRGKRLGVVEDNCSRDDDSVCREVGGGTIGNEDNKRATGRFKRKR